MLASFRIEYRTRWGESLCLVAGDIKYPMKWNDGNIWSVTLPECGDDELGDYYYIVMEDGLIRRSEWSHHHRKAGSGRKSVRVSDKWIDCPIEGCPFPREHQAAIFDRPGFRGAGTAIPVFSLRSESDFGIGEFRDIRKLVDWAAETGQCVLQFLPVNDTTRNGGWDDSYPYSPISSFGLNPLYIHLQDLGIKETAAFRKEREELNSLPEIDYPKVFAKKTAWMRRAFKAGGSKDMKSAAFAEFCRQNAFWLQEYCEFCTERDGLEKEYYAWIQFHLDRQLGEEAAYARSKGVHLKGDLPIGVSGDSVEAHFHPELFNLDSSAGAPPDFFSADGQNWGFPTYNWEEMSKDDFAWWKSRLRVMSRYFDAFRIDHILGFFRIWEIPNGCSSGMYGHFNPALPYSSREIQDRGLPFEGLFHEDPRHPGFWQPLITPDSAKLPQWQQETFGAMYNDFFFHRHEEFWRRNAERKLPELLSATGMLACGEDLGMVPDCVPGVMEHEKILSLKMRGMEGEGEWKELSVCATSSHDMETLRMQCGSDPEPSDVVKILSGFLHSPSMLAIFPFQDWLALDGELRRADYMTERINYPADPHNHWKFRIHFPLEKLCGEECRDFNGKIRALITGSGRGTLPPRKP